MKTYITSFIIILFAITTMNAQKVKGNGKIKTETRSVGDYDRVYVNGSFEVHLVEGKEGDIEIKGESNIIPHISVKVVDGTLKIGTKKKTSLYYKKDLVITVPIKHIDGVSLSGSGEIYSKHVIKEQELNVNLSGSGDVELKIETSRVLTTVTGSGDMELTGSTQYLRVNVTGSGDFHGETLDSRMTDVMVTGSGDADVNASEFISAHVTGSGDIAYSGNPAKEKIEVTGSGDISKR